jgi:Anti-sigma-K factor rskA/Sigma-70, region 4
MGRRMSPLEPLAPDQRAVVALVLQQGRSYDEIAALLGIPVDAVRARARAGLAALAPMNGLPDEITAPLADYLLGQQPDADADATRGLLAESAPARAWASDVAGRLSDVAKAPLPEIPHGERPRPGADEAPSAEDAARPADSSGADEASFGAETARAADNASPPGPRPRPVREADAPPPASRLGGVLLIAGVIAVVGAVLFFVLRGGDEEEPASSGTGTAAATATPTPTATPQVADEIALRPASGGRARGTMTVYLQNDQLLFALQGERLPPSGQNDAYAVWFTGPGDKARRLGFTNPVGDDGKLGIQGPSQKDVESFPKMYATYENVVVSQESDENAKRPTRVVMTGKLPQGR